MCASCHRLDHSVNEGAVTPLKKTQDKLYNGPTREIEVHARCSRPVRSYNIKPDVDLQILETTALQNYPSPRTSSG